MKRSVKASPEQLTNDGVPGIVFNGVPDWVFEEEVFEDNAALWWSPDASQIVWGAFDDTDVEIYDLPTYGTWQKFKQYPDVKELRYPKVNTTNPKSTLWVADLRPDQRVQQASGASTQRFRQALFNIRFLLVEKLLHTGHPF